MSADIAVIGLAVMGENLALNFESRGFTVAVHNRTTSKIDEFIAGRAKGKKFVGCHTLPDLVKALKAPRKVMLMVRAGDVVDSYVNQLVPILEKGDIIIDGGNSNFQDTNRRVKDVESKGLLFVGAGVSGGEEGALTGPSIMPGGSSAAWPAVKPLFQAIAAKVEDGTPCCDWVGDGGAGHFVKMVHNGIEYGDMQLICEGYNLMKVVLGMDNEKLSAAFCEWKKGDLDSYLIEITADILTKKENGVYVVDTVLDAAGQKGTGKWTVESALNLTVPVTLIAEAVFARCLSALKEARVAASKEFTNLKLTPFAGDPAQFLNHIRDALFAAKLVSYAQGFAQMRAAAKEYKWNLNYGAVALMWRGGCIIRSKFLGNIRDAFAQNPELQNLLLDPYFKGKIEANHAGWRQVASVAVLAGIPIPAISSALAYFDGYRAAWLPHNLLQSQRDYFGAHTYERVDQERGKFFHFNWTGHGGSTSSSTYQV